MRLIHPRNHLFRHAGAIQCEGARMDSVDLPHSDADGCSFRYWDDYRKHISARLTTDS